MAEPARIVCFGDSISESKGAEINRWPVLLQFRLEAWRPGRYEVYNRGVGGDTTWQGLERMNTDILPLLPAVVLIEFGLNDANCREWRRNPRIELAAFCQNLAEMAALVRKGGGKPVFVAVHRPHGKVGAQGDRRSYHARVDEYNRAVRSTARRLRAPCIDFGAWMRRQATPVAEFMSDCVHLSPAGNRLLADCIFHGLQPIL